jgi:phage tail protein X
MMAGTTTELLQRWRAGESDALDDLLPQVYGELRRLAASALGAHKGHATLQPTKLELVASWLPSRSWFADDAAGDLVQVGAFRFDDPAGDVGLQVLIVRAAEDGPLYQVPLTYRDAPLEGATDGLVGEAAHSILGTRYVYDGCHDPVFVAALARVVLTGGHEADELLEVDGESTTLPKTMHARGSGQPMAAAPILGPLQVTSAGGDGSLSVVRAGSVEVTVPRVLVAGTTIDGASTLVGEWEDGRTACLATVRLVESP